LAISAETMPRIFTYYMLFIPQTVEELANSQFKKKLQVIFVGSIASKHHV